MIRPTNPALAGLVLAVLPACNALRWDSAPDKAIEGYRVGAMKYFNHRQYERAIDQARRGLELEPDDYKLLGPLAWSYLQLSFKDTPENEKFLKLAEKAFEDVIALRSIEKHDPRNVFGYAIAQHNWARVEEGRARIYRREAANTPEESEKLAKLAAAEEHERAAKRKDIGAMKYFRHVVDDSFSAPKNLREAFKYLMAIEYRHGNYDKAIEYGEKALERNAQERAKWERDYAATKFAEREPILRADLADLKNEEIKVRTRLAGYHQELAKKPENKNYKTDYEAAIVHLSAILAARPNSAPDYYRRGFCYRAVGNQEAARKDFQLFLRLGNYSKDHEAVKDAQQFVYGRGK